MATTLNRLKKTNREGSSPASSIGNGSGNGTSEENDDSSRSIRKSKTLKKILGG
jgi:hypothetical protein